SGFIKSFTAVIYHARLTTTFNQDFKHTAKAVRWQFILNNPSAHIAKADGHARPPSASSIGKSRFHSYSKPQRL
ncbi:MAG TPA: hypothetical protein VLT56_03065, partial [Desulfobacterales bacterium]|nr:hypothetical protein [Desulfobacterales bacterium]